MKCEVCKRESENVESVCGGETDFESMLLCELCQERLYNKFYGLEKPEDNGNEGFMS